MSRTYPRLHPWDVSAARAREIQEQLRGLVILEDQLHGIGRVAGVDVGFEQGNRVTRAAVAVLSFPGLELLESTIVRQPTRFPYIPGLLSFREIPALIEALEQLRQEPDLLLCDGQGIAHPRRFGIACHLGVLTGIPSIGVAKTRLLGTHAQVPYHKGGYVPLMQHGEQIGVVLRSRDGVKPLYISPGHKISLASSIHYVMQCLTRYRLPETTRQAHRLASGADSPAARL